MDPSEAKRVAREHRPTLRGRIVAFFTRTWAGCRRCGEPDPCPRRSEAWDVLDDTGHGKPPTPGEWQVKW